MEVEMRPAGMSSDEDEDDDYFSMTIMRKKSDGDAKENKFVEYLPPDQSHGLRTLLDSATKSSLFHQAVEQADFSRMEELLENGVSVDDSKINEWTPLMKACSEGKHEVVLFLLDKGANPNLHKELFTPLMACCLQNYFPESERLECARLLIQFGANVNATDKHKGTALMMAAGNGLGDIVAEILNSPNVDVNLVDKEGWNAIFYAVNHNHKNIVEKLVSAGINVNTLNRHGEYNPIQLAQMKNHKAIVKILENVQGEPKTEGTASTEVTDSVFSLIRDSLCEFRSQFPDERGRGGFSRDIRDIFAGVGLGKLYDKLKINIGFPDFLVCRDLGEMGVKYEPLRRKIRKGIHRYHLAPWRKNSLYPFQSMKEVNMENYIQAISNVTKHLAIMYATLVYVKSRIGNWNVKSHVGLDKELIDLLIESYVEVQKARTLLENILANATRIKPIDEVEADYVGPEKIHREGVRGWRSTVLKVGLACTVLYLCCKIRFS